ncbi:3-deoxy-D-manno-octulosonic acid transferase [Pasteurellaceae bacterium RH1A]|nr:3-deoxy-D-manno-octulosonic acid transferase [Pasteurellaceae bacterium RH1A]
MLRFCYTLLSYFLQPFILLLMVKRSLKQPAYKKRLSERYACYGQSPQPQPHGIVIHAASVGEVIAITPLVKAMQQQYPGLPITFTTITPTGSERVKAAFGTSVSHFYLPYDLPDAIGRFLNFVQPKAFIVVETELWPNLIQATHKRGIPFIIANARLSPRSAQRYGWIKPALKKMFSSIELIMAQDKVSADRYLQLGFNPAHLVNTGNLKFDLKVSPEHRQGIIATREQLQLAHRLVWIAGSTHEGEEKLILDAHQALLKTYPDLVLILVPRHPERFEAVAELIEKSPLTFVRRSSGQALASSHQVLLGDTMGEMMLLYGLSQMAFVGGSLVKHGGHNPLEPIAFEIPVISGIHTYNFPEIFVKLREVNGVIEIESQAQALVQAVDFLLKSPNQAEKVAQAGFEVLKENQGALERHLQLLTPYLENKS